MKHFLDRISSRLGNIHTNFRMFIVNFLLWISPARMLIKIGFPHKILIKDNQTNNIPWYKLNPRTNLLERFVNLGLRSIILTLSIYQEITHNQNLFLIQTKFLIISPSAMSSIILLMWLWQLSNTLIIIVAKMTIHKTSLTTRIPLVSLRSSRHQRLRWTSPRTTITIIIMINRKATHP